MIEFENVSFSYTGQEHGGLRDINLKISDGECVLFCGRSGCGKTTITRLVNGLIPQFYQGELHGRVLVDGQEISNIPMYQIAAKVGSVFQNPRTQFFNVDTDSEIAFGIENEARPPEKLAERVEQTTEDLHIQKLRNRNIFELSGGEKQKIAFASVYAMNPQIYLLDEPSSNLDMTSIQELKEHLRLIKKQGKTVLIAEHRLYYLMELADRIVYLEKGEIKGIYTPEEFWQLSEPDREHMGLRATLLGLMSKKNHWVAIMISAAIFGLAHANVAQFVNALLLGLLLGWMYYRTKSLVPGILLHWVNNTMAYVLSNIMPQSDGKLIDLFYGDEKITRDRKSVV